MKKRHLLELDGLRGVAALAVALFHGRAAFGGDYFFGHAYLAVDFFFMLSGFVLQRAYGVSLANRGHLKRFYTDRIIRLYPLLVLSAGVALFAWIGLHGITMDGIARAITCALGIPAIWQRLCFDINIPYWSLFCEIIANICWAPLVPLLPRRNRLIAVALGALTLLLFSAHYHGLDVGSTRGEIVGGMVRVGFGFLTGTLLSDLHDGGVLAGGGRRWYVGAALLGSFLILPNHSGWSTFYDLLVVFAIYPTLILLAAGSEPLVPKIAIFSGEISYAFYLLHVPAYRFLQLINNGNMLSASATQELVCLSILVIASWAIVRFYDEPIRKRLRRVLIRRPLFQGS